MSGRTAANIERPTVDQGHALFFQYAVRVEPRLLVSLESEVLETYRKTFRAELGIDAGRAGLLANRLGWEQDVTLTPEEKTTLKAQEGGEEASPQEPAAPPADRWPEVFYRDPTPNPKLGAKLRRQRVRRKRSIKQEARRRKILPPELEEMERGCHPRGGLTSWHGTEPLRRALLKWAAHWHLTDVWCLDWVLAQLQTWPPETSMPYRFDQLGVIPLSPSRLPAWSPFTQTRKQYIREVNERFVAPYCDEVERSVEYLGVKRGGGKRRQYVGRVERHIQWLAGYQVAGWAKYRIAKSAGMNPTAVLRALRQTAERIGLILRPAAANKPDWTDSRIRACLAQLSSEN
jgi:hypothetical protein